MTWHNMLWIRRYLHRNYLHKLIVDFFKKYCGVCLMETPPFSSLVHRESACLSFKRYYQKIPEPKTTNLHRLTNSVECVHTPNFLKFWYWILSALKNSFFFFFFLLSVGQEDLPCCCDGISFVTDMITYLSIRD